MLRRIDECSPARQHIEAIGIEINRDWAEVARERIRADVSGSDYAARMRV